MPHLNIQERENGLDSPPISIRDILLLSPILTCKPAVFSTSPFDEFLSMTPQSTQSPALSKSISPPSMNSFLNARFLISSSPYEYGYSNQHSPSQVPTSSFPETTSLPPLFSTDLPKTCSEFLPAAQTQLSPFPLNSQPSDLLEHLLESPVVRRSLGDVTPPYQTHMSQSEPQDHPHNHHDHQRHHTLVRSTSNAVDKGQLSMPTTPQISNNSAADQPSPPALAASSQLVSDTPFIDRIRQTTGRLVPASFSPVHRSLRSRSFTQTVPLASPFSGETRVGHRLASDGVSVGNSQTDRFLCMDATPPSKPYLDFWNSPLTDSESSSRSPSISPTSMHGHEDFVPAHIFSTQDLGPKATCGAVLEAIKRPQAPEETSNALQQTKRRKLNSVRPRKGSVTAKPKSETHSISEGQVEDTVESEFDLRKYRRTFPSEIPIREEFSAFYRQYPIISFFHPNHCKTSVLLTGKTKRPPPSSTPNEPRSAYDLYTPRFVKGVGINKVGLCPLCFEPKSRGGNGTIEWLAMKVSAYKCYHLQYVHGISSFTGAPFSPPIAFRVSERRPIEVRKHEKTELLQGKCHKCEKWVAVEGVKIGEVKVKELYWWKHAASCHKSTTVPGEGDIFIHDHVYDKLTEYETSLANQRLQS